MSSGGKNWYGAWFRWRWASALFVGGVAVFGAAALDGEPTIPEDALRQLVEGSAFRTHIPLGGPDTFGSSAESPASLGSLKPSYSHLDVSVSGAFGPIQVMRSGTTALQAWGDGKAVDQGTPFGFERGHNNFVRLAWWHNLHSYVATKVTFPKPCVPPEPNNPDCDGQEIVEWELVGGPAGTSKSYRACEDYGCFGQNYSEQNVKLQFLENHGFVAHARDGRYYYRPMSGVVGPLMLSYIEPAQYDEPSCSEEEDGGTDVASSCHKRIARLNYELPAECMTGSQADIAATVGVASPRLRTAVSSNGTKIVFRYQRLASRVSDLFLYVTKSHECVLKSVDLVGRDGTVEADAVKYHYVEKMVPGTGMQEVAGLLSGVEWPNRDGGPDTGSLIEYKYEDNGTPIWEVKRDGVRAVRQVLGGDGGTLSDDSDGEPWPAEAHRYFVTAEVNGCWPGVFQPTGNCKSQDRTFTTYGRTIGDGSGYFAQLVRHTFQVDSTGVGPVGDQGPTVRGMKTTVQCGDWPCPGIEDPFNASNSEWYVGAIRLDPGGQRAVDVAAGERHANGAYTVYDHELAPAGSSPVVGVLPPAELKTVLEGAASADGSGALRSRTHSYIYGGAGRPVDVRAFEQLLKQTTVPSTFSDEEQGLEASTRNHYDPITNRLMASIRKGYTLKFWPEDNSWTREERSIGTFYKTHDVCTSPAVEDSQGRVRTVLGPCDVETGSDTSCASAVVPMVVYEYWEAAELGNRAGRIKAKRVYPDGCGSTPVVTSFDAYDVRGRLTQATDPNGVVAKYQYEGDELIRKVAAAGDAQFEAITEYGYDDNASHGDYVRHPDGRYEVLCYRKNTSPGLGCVGGVRTKVLQWKASSGHPSGATHSERVDYEYHLGSLRSETIRDATGQVRRTRFYDRDPLEKLTFSAWGVAGPSLPGETRFAQTGLFDRGGNQVGIGQSYQSQLSEPEAFCGGFLNAGPGGATPKLPASPHCKALAYDRLNRLTGLLEPLDLPGTPGEAAKMCFSYDVSGNLRSIRQGCPGGGAPGDCSQCSQPLQEYRHDDFGNLVQVLAPWAGRSPSSSGAATPGLFRFQYNASGGLIRRQTPAMRTAVNPHWVENTLDMMGRTLKVEAVTHLDDDEESRNLLSWYSYDQSVPPPWGCPGVDATRPARSMGRPQVLTDSFGDTWFQYDVHGNLIALARSRAAANFLPRTKLCLDVRIAEFPSIHRYYDHASRLVNEAYPGGRGTWYHYYESSTGNSHRVASMDVTVWNGTAFDGFMKIVDDVRWEPYGGLLSYVLIAPQAPQGSQRARVTYHRGGGNVPLSSCSSTYFTQGGDTTGRLSGLTVSRVEQGSVLGDIFKRAYTWKADQLLQEDTCLLETGNVAPESVRYAHGSTSAPGYDGRLQLRSAHRMGAASPSGTLAERRYDYDLRGNRTVDVQDDWRHLSEFDSSRVDWLTSRYLASGLCQGSPCVPRFSVTQRYGYDEDGRVNRIATYKNQSDPVGSPFFTTDLDASSAGKNAALGMVYRQITDSAGRKYEYFYDAWGRRRLKRYSMSGAPGVEEELFYSGVSLLEDWGVTSFDPATAESVRDEYFWLDGRPIAFFKVRITQGQQRIADFVGDCPRYGESAPCGLYFLVSDELGKPVLALDSARRITGVADYDPYGHVNRKVLVADSPVTSSGQGSIMATIQLTGSQSLISQVRARFSFVEIPEGSSVFLTDANGVILTGVDGESSVMSEMTEPSVFSKWVSYSGETQIRFLTGGASGGAQDASLAGFEYRRFQNGAAPVWTPLRFPGQYHDIETDFFENWNRFYDPATGRYLAPDPVAFAPRTLLGQAMAGRVVGGYVYAGNNPVNGMDPDGLLIKIRPLGDNYTEDDVTRYMQANDYLEELLADEILGADARKIADDPDFLLTIDWNWEEFGSGSKLYAGFMDPAEDGKSATLLLNRNFSALEKHVVGSVKGDKGSTFFHEFGHASKYYERRPALKLRSNKKGYDIDDGKERKINNEAAIEWEKRYFEKRGRPPRVGSHDG